MLGKAHTGRAGWLLDLGTTVTRRKENAIPEIKPDIFVMLVVQDLVHGVLEDVPVVIHGILDLATGGDVT